MKRSAIIAALIPALLEPVNDHPNCNGTCPAGVAVAAGGGKERTLTGLAVVWVEDGNGHRPGGAMGIVDPAQVEDVPWRCAAPDALALAA